MEFSVENMERLRNDIEVLLNKYDMKNHRKMLWSLILWDVEEEICGKVKDYNQYRRLVDKKMEMELKRTLCGGDE